MAEQRLVRSKKPSKEYDGNVPDNRKNQPKPKQTTYTTTVKCNQPTPKINKPIFRQPPRNVPPPAVSKRIEKDLETPIECKFGLDCHFIGKDCKNGSHEEHFKKMDEFFTQPKERLTKIFGTAMQAKEDGVPPCAFKASCWFAFSESPKCKKQHYDSLKEVELKYYKILSEKPKNIVRDSPTKNKKESPTKNKNESPAKNKIPEDIIKMHLKTKMLQRNNNASTKNVYYEDPYGKTYALNKVTNELYIVENEIAKRVEIYSYDGEEYGKDVDGTIYKIENAEQQEQLVKYCIEMI